MLYRRFLLSVLVLLPISRFGLAQEILSVDQQTLNQHVDRRVDPIYPPIAKAARIQGTVVIQIQVGTTGKVESTKVVSGPAMLQQAAIDCLKQWTYRPFEKDGSSVAASGTVSIEFSLGKDGPTPKEEEISQRYFPLFMQCNKAISAGTDRAAAEAVCNKVAETAMEFAPDVRFIERRSAFEYAATASANNRDLTSAMAWAVKAVEVAKLGHDDNSGNNAVYSTKGMIEGMMGDLAASDQDLSVAEDYERKGIAHMEIDSPGMAKNYRSVLAQDLRFHAQVLQRLNRPDEAQKKLDEAEQLMK
jgi:TonB family protein